MVAASRLIHKHRQEPVRPQASTGQAEGGTRAGQLLLQQVLATRTTWHPSDSTPCTHLASFLAAPSPGSSLRAVVPAGFPKKPFSPHYLANTNQLFCPPPPEPHPNQLLPSWERCKHLKGRDESPSLCSLWARSDP